MQHETVKVVSIRPRFASDGKPGFPPADFPYAAPVAGKRSGTG
jgi:hypothetical protein